MTTQIATIPGGALLPTESDYGVMWRMAEAFVQSGLMPEGVKTPAAALLMIQKGRELGIPPSYACSNIHVIKGKPTCSAELMMALILSRVGSDAIIIEETTTELCEVSYVRPGWDKRRVFSWTIQQAKAAQLLSNPMWAKYPDAMLRARCISAAARLAFPDIIGGMYTPEEMGAAVEMMPSGAVEIVQEPTPVPARVDTETGEIHRAETIQNADPDRAMKRVHAVGREKGLGHDAIKTLAVGMMAERGAAIEHLADLGEKGLDGLASYVERTDAETLAARVASYGAAKDQSGPETPDMGAKPEVKRETRHKCANCGKVKSFDPAGSVAAYGKPTCPECAFNIERGLQEQAKARKLAEVAPSEPIGAGDDPFVDSQPDEPALAV